MLIRFDEIQDEELAEIRFRTTGKHVLSVRFGSLSSFNDSQDCQKSIDELKTLQQGNRREKFCRNYSGYFNTSAETSNSFTSASETEELSELLNLKFQVDQNFRTQDFAG